MTYEVRPVGPRTFNLKGWEIVRSDGKMLGPFPQKLQAEKLVAFFIAAERENCENESVA